MSQRDTDKALAAQERSQETKSFVRTVKAATRRKYPPEEKIRIVLEGFRRCWQPAKVGQLRTREIICYEEALVSSLRVLL